MIQVLDQNDKEIYKYRLAQGENKFGSDSKLCKFLIRNVQSVLFSVALINNDVYFTHFSDTSNVYKDSTLKPYSKVEIPKNFLIEIFPTKNYYFQTYKFKLLDLSESSQQNTCNQVGTTQNLEEFSGTMPLEDIFQIPQQAQKLSTTQSFCTTTQVLNTQDPCSSTLIIEEGDQTEIFTLNELIVQYSNMRLMNQLTTNDKQEAATQTDLIEKEPPPVQKKGTLFSDLFKIKKQQQTTPNVVPKVQAPEPQIVDSTVIDSQLLGATVNDEEQQKFFEQNNEIKGTMIDEELEKAFSSQFNNKEEQKSQVSHSQFNRMNSIKSENVYTTPKMDVNSNIELNDIFGSLPELPNQSIVQPQVIKKFSSLKSNLFSIKTEEIQEEKNQSQQDDTPKKLRQQENRGTENKKKRDKKKKDVVKQVGMLKKITDEISNNSISELEEEKIQPKQQLPRHSNSMELPNTKILEEKAQNIVPKSRRGLRKKRLVNNDRQFRTIAFSGFSENEIPSEKDLMKLDLELVENQFEKFDLLIINTPFKRTFKFLAALMHGAEIVTADWLKDSLAQYDQQNHQNYVPESEEFQKQFGLSIKQIIQCRDDYFESNDNIVEIFEGKYYVNEDVIPSKGEIEYLIKLGGGQVVRKANKNVYVISESKKPNTYASDFILDACMFQQ
ncbi:unnamed protein product [Paramecium octaurelia]|uniref:BRCT domain-containing protein n=1 Tax=Paramecium octaurelia TaxID=43137 RepID=A0A8S1WUM4_PAROT|nr:unnamed protein product [Paramecium octaurelia]